MEVDEGYRKKKLSKYVDEAEVTKVNKEVNEWNESLDQ